MDLLVAALTADIVVARNALSCYKSKIMNDSIELELINQSIHTTLNKVNINLHVLRTYPFSNASTPAMVVPPGDVTPSFNKPGCFPVCNTISAAPLTV